MSMKVLRSAVVPSLLLVVACVHFARAVTFGQTPWKGGGFGMFSSIDGPQTRFLEVYISSDGKRIPVKVPVGLTRHIAAALTLPDSRRLERLAALFLAAEWRRADRSVIVASSVEVIVCRVSYDRGSGRIAVVDIVEVKKSQMPQLSLRVQQEETGGR